MEKKIKRNQTKTRIVTIDTIGPRVTSLNATPNNTYNLTVEINITANITDTATVDTVRANITYPNNTITQITLSQGIGNTYNNTFTAPNLAGTYTVRIIANDTVSNINSSETTTFVIVNDPPNPSSTQIHAGNDITLTSGTNTTIIGNATVTDLNGYNDITSVTGYLFLTTTGVDAADNRTTHYTSACTDNGDGSGNTVTYNCTFNVSHLSLIHI